MQIYNVDANGNYWSSTKEGYNESEGKYNALRFADNQLKNVSNPKYRGYSVRLVHNVP